ncbi:DNA-3-methyladenine glycosylase family protein [Paenisporosarcina quisquiliarum]|uniref:DNA-3-methyladenine glycosylase family protein n=1 Tax=Paenisporosarcina quisquiliarum TaxID=365346 RepID=UPI0037366196
MKRIIELDFAYDFERVLDRLSMDPIISLNKDKRSVHIPLEEGKILTLRATGTTNQPVFELDGVESEEQMNFVKEIFHFDRSLDPIHEHFASTNLSAVFDEHKGTPIVREFSLYATLMKSIIHQQLNLAFAHTLTTRFVHTYGHEIDGVWFYPKPEKIARLQVEELRELQFSTRKAEYVIGVSQAIASGELNLEKLALEDDDTITQTLIKYRGIGPWTAQSFLLFGLGRPNLFPLADIGLQNALKKLWGSTEKPKAEEMSSHFPQWSPFLSYASLYLWRSIE